jgi:signal transduction histidine kinase
MHADAPPAELQRFERAVSDRQYGGLGIGLYVARQIVEAHGGAIAASSDPEHGTELRVELPPSPPMQRERT